MPIRNDEDVLMQLLIDQGLDPNVINQLRQEQNPPQRARPAQTQYVPGAGADWYGYFRALIADLFVFSLGLALWRVSAYYTVSGVVDFANFLGMTQLAALFTVSWGLSWSLLIPVAISAVEQEFTPWQLSDSSRADPTSGELLAFVFFAGIGVLATIYGATRDFAIGLTRLAGPENVWTIAYTLAIVVIIALAVLLELAPEPIIREFGGRAFVRLPFGRWIAGRWTALRRAIATGRNTKRVAAQRAARAR